MSSLFPTKKTSCGLCCTKITDFTVQRSGKAVLSQVNLHIHCGELTAVIGPNGAGKTTLLLAILGAIPHQGKLSFLDHKGAHTGKPVIGYVPQKLHFNEYSPFTVADLYTVQITWLPIWLIHTKKTEERIRRNLSIVHAEHLLHKKIASLSGGELQRVMLAMALDPIPDLLLLDEPASNMDEQGIKMFYEILARLRSELDLSIIIVSHDLEMTAQYANRVILLNRKLLAVGKAIEVFQSTPFLEIFGSVWTKLHFANLENPIADTPHAAP